ncbi:MAG: hypothetical protein ACERKD_21795 [Prolixibacteraceae bacterium]
MEKTRKFATITLWVLMAISAILFVVMVSSIDSETNPGERAVQMITMNMNWAIVLFAISAVMSLGFAMVQMFSDKKSAISALIILALFAVIILVANLLSDRSIPQFFGVEKYVADGTLTETISHWIGTGLYVTYILFAGAFLSIIGFGAVGIFKRS